METDQMPVTDELPGAAPEELPSLASLFEDENWKTLKGDERRKVVNDWYDKAIPAGKATDLERVRDVNFTDLNYGLRTETKENIPYLESQKNALLEFSKATAGLVPGAPGSEGRMALAAQR
jgi:hypothetical protein